MVTEDERNEHRRQHVAALLTTSLPAYIVTDWPGEVMWGGSSSHHDVVYAIEMLHTDDSVRPRAWMRVRSVADAQPGDRGLAGAARVLAGRIHVRSHPDEGTDPAPAIDAICSRLLSASRKVTHVLVEATRLPAVIVRDPGSDCWLVHADRGDHEVVLTGEHGNPTSVSLAAAPSVEPLLPDPLRP